MARIARFPHLFLVGTSLLALAACSDFDDFDLDMRGSGGSAADTSDAVRNATASRPAPDNRGVISYPNYQVAVAQRGDTVTTVADRVGLPAAELARFNGLPLNAVLREGEVVALPSRVTEPSAATGAITSGPITPGSVDITTLAGNAIDRSTTTTATTRAPSSGVEPQRHQVQPGESAFTISRQYNVSVEALAEWNGLPNDYSVRQGQYLLIPVVIGGPTLSPTATVAPGVGSVTPEPPSAATPLPPTSPGPEPVAAPPAAEMAPERTEASDTAQFQMPVAGSIVRDFDADDFTGIGISASAGAPVSAAADGSVMLITRDTNQNAILVLRHSGDLLTVYSGIDSISVERGDTVTRGQDIAKIRAGSPSSLFFQVRKGNETFDPLPYLQ